jgi:hypothetical protein
MRWRISWQRIIVSLAILALTVSVATRTFHGFYPEDPSAQSSPTHTMRQHLAADAVEVTNPVLHFASLLLPVAAPHAPPSEPKICSVEFSKSLYNRPPPSVSLFS